MSFNGAPVSLSAVAAPLPVEDWVLLEQAAASVRTTAKS
jgi:hypothetical protein